MRAIYFIVASYVVLWTAEGGDLETQRSTAQAPGPYAPVTFASCAGNDTIHEARISAIRNEILIKLRLTQTPRNLRRPPLINKSTLSAYHAAEQTADERRTSMASCGRGTFFAKHLLLYFPTRYQPMIPPAEMFDWGPLGLLEAVVKTKRGIDASLYQDYVPPTSYKLFFELNLRHDTLIWSADLRLYKKKTLNFNVKQEQSPQMMENIQIYYVSHAEGKDGKGVENWILVSSKNVEAHREGYESFDVTFAVRKWIEERSNVLELEVVIKCPESVVTGLAFLPSIEFALGDNKEYNHTAQLVVASLQKDEVDRSTGARGKRQTESVNRFCLNNPGEPNCCIRKLNINFRRDFGWNWIIAPRSFRPNYCDGLCPFLWPSASTSTTLLTRYRELNPTAAVEPCCVATSLRPLTVLIVVNGRIFLEELSGMIVESCICE